MTRKIFSTAAAVIVGVATFWSAFAAPVGPATRPAQTATPSEIAVPVSDAARDNYIAALDSLSDEQAEMVPVVLAAIGEIECDGLAVDRSKSASFIAAHAADTTAKARGDETAIAKSASDALTKPWLDYVQEDPTQFCQQAYALGDSGRDLWKH